MAVAATVSPSQAGAFPRGTPSLPLSQLLTQTADAVQAVRAGTSLNEALARCPVAARPGTQALAFHALRRLGSAQLVLAQVAPKAPSPGVDALLLVAIALLWPSEEPPYTEHTLVDQTVTAMHRRAPKSVAFANAVLRRFIRERSALVELAARDPIGRDNHPVWWVERLRADWPADWQAILDADNLRPPMTLRVNARRSSAAAYVERLAKEGIAAHAVDARGGPAGDAAAAPSPAVMLEKPVPVTQLPGFAEGDVSVQDAAAQRAAPLLVEALFGARETARRTRQSSPSQPLSPGADGVPRPLPSDVDSASLPRPRVLDACAAPGGKTAHLLELADLDVVAIDRDPARLAKVDQTLRRLDLHASTLAADAGDPAAWWDGRAFDAILLDAPCSASGIVRRHPDVRWLRRAADIETLAATQARLLDALWPLLAPGGHMLFCTCSVFRAEGEHQIDAFLQRERRATLAASPSSPGHLLPLADNRGLAAAPGFSTASDGFFYALIQKPPD